MDVEEAEDNTRWRHTSLPVSVSVCEHVSECVCVSVCVCVSK